MSRTPLADLVHRAELPFVGRFHELRLLQQFWSKHGAAAQLRAALIVGEAGVGKSRLLHHFLHQISGSEPLLVHIKFPPESLTSPLRAVARALESALDAKSIPHRQIRTLQNIAEAIPDLAKQHRLMVVLEDIHVLEQAGQQSLMQLLALLRDFPITLLCLGRPLSGDWIEMLEPYLKLHLELHGLGLQEIEELWKRLFAEQPDGLVSDSIANATLGNPLVIRSGLLRALQQGAIQTAVRTAGITVSISLPKFRTSLLASTQSLSEAMVQLLNPEQQRALQLLASLGEVFSIEAARYIVPNFQEILPVLIRRGIIGQTLSALPPLHVSSISQERLLTFTHTVLHRELLSSSTPEIELLINLIAIDISIYSIIPYTLIGTADCHASIPDAVLIQAIDVTIEINSQLVESEDWKFSLMLFDSIQRMRAWLTDPLPAETAQRYQLDLLMQQMEYVTNIRDRKEYLRLLEQLLELTSQDLPEDIAPFRLAALSAEARQIAIDAPHRKPELAKSLYHALQQFSHRRDHVGYMVGVIAMSELAQSVGLVGINKWAVAEVKDIIQRYDLNDLSYKVRYLETLPFVVHHFTTREEFEQNIQLIEELERSGETNLILQAEYAHLLAADGQIEQVYAIIQEILVPLRRLGNYRYYLSVIAAKNLVWGMEGRSTSEMLNDLHSVADEITGILPLGMNYAEIALSTILGQNIESSDELEKMIPSMRAQHRRNIHIYMALCDNDPTLLKNLILQEEEMTNDRIIHWLLTATEWTLPMEEAVAAALQADPITVHGLLTFRCLVQGVERMEHRIGIRTPAIVADAAVAGMNRSLEWIEQRGITPYKSALIERFGYLLKNRDNAPPSYQLSESV